MTVRSLPSEPPAECSSAERRWAQAFPVAMGTPPPTTQAAAKTVSDDYIIGPGDVLEVFVWRNPELSVTVPVRPDGRVSTPLVEDMVAVGKTPSTLARDIEKVMHITQPSLTALARATVITALQSDATAAQVKSATGVAEIGTAAGPGCSGVAGDERLTRVHHNTHQTRTG